MIGIIDYGAGNIRSVQKAVEHLGYPCKLVSTCEEIDACDAYILPGVGAFSAAMEHLKPVQDCLLRNVKGGKYLLGICLGLQLLFDKSYEDGEFSGLSLIPGQVVKFDGSYKVPHMGWNQLQTNREDEIGKDVAGSVYFVHSYYVQPENEQDVVFYAEYGVDVPALVRRENVIGMQFHPEKSSKTGLQLLKNFLEIVS